MGLFGKLQKLKILSFSSVERIGLSMDAYTALLNPETYSQKFTIKYNSEQASGSSTVTQKYARSLPDDLELEFLFDRTGVLSDERGSLGLGSLIASGAGVKVDVEHFKKVVYNFYGKTHRPNFLIITWGTLIYPCVLTDLSIDYKLFRADGVPLRAIAKVKFKYDVSPKKIALFEKRNSPDLTHYRTVKDGDTLPLMTHKIYGDSKYYLEVAKVNNLSNFRKLTPGQELIFPPLVKASSL